MRRTYLCHIVDCVGCLDQKVKGHGGNVQKEVQVHSLSCGPKNEKYNGEHIEYIVLPILHKFEEQNILFSEVRENVFMMNQIKTSHAMFIQLLET